MATRWWLVVMVLGLVALPITQALLGDLADKGYAFTKLVGLLLVSYLFWLAASLGFVLNGIGSIALALALLGGLSVWLLLRNRRNGRDGSLRHWFQQSWRYILLSELLFVAVFALWIYVRAQNPAISATEKPMEFAFLNSASRSPTYPPADPWLSGFGISYYYFGYVMVSVISRLALVPEQIGFNLAIAWLVAATALGAFGIIFNLLTGNARRLRRTTVLLALVAALALPLAGNQTMALEMAYGNGLGNAQFWNWLDVRDLTGTPPVDETPRYEGANWWWWRSSRVIHEYHLSGREEAGLEPIAEFPAFSFVLGDLHPHVLALPYALLSIAVAAQWWKRFGARTARRLNGDGRPLSKRQWYRKFLDQNAALILFTALLLGGLSFLNTWDVGIHLFVVSGAFLLARWQVYGGWTRRALYEALAIMFTLATAAVLLYLPFYLGFRSQAGPPFLLPMVMRPTRLAHFLVIFGMPLSVITIWLGCMLWRRRRTPVLRRRLKRVLLLVGALLLMLFLALVGLSWVVAASPDGAVRVNAIAAELGHNLPQLTAGGAFDQQALWALQAIAALAPELLATRAQYSGLVLFLSAVLAAALILLSLLVEARPQERSVETAVEAPRSIPQAATAADNGVSMTPFVLLLLLTATLLALGPEFVYLRDNFGARLNTIFKFYYQAWLLYGLVAVFALGYLWQHHRRSGIVAASLYSLMLLIGLSFPYHAVQSRSVEYRGRSEATTRLPATLDGLAYLEHFEPDEYEAIMWLRNTAPQSANIVEAVGGQYSSFGRVSASTGLPTILGWPGHEYQWRGETDEPALREPAVEAIYGAASWSQTAMLLNRYDVDYVYYGSLERTAYGIRADRKFEQNMNVAFRNNSVTIYRWQPGRGS